MPGVTVRFPKTEEGIQRLARKLAEIHTDMVRLQLQKMDGSPEEKKRILEEMLRTLKESRDTTV